ncbi:BlaI/MecI/CopY family transcriptional regulator [Sphingosinicella sp. LHD-64]|uniref:BlaI/MecI/CopY family transcriptional regulator n=1 Tax=Sphingosinicella sp. LHD-64 TaxID=3072139 RepID=UPI00280CE115|nr:BlaI/MecI/CopY family transcriptional regulator [Sphingosinicella sp. LHD-64]MDQ8754931.1 BlaI/MecI/CopY family transcriptional regulator [Sphingosinicella sp. LHD-64]
MIERLPRREREVARIVHALGEASANDVRRALQDPLSNAAVRSMLQRIEAKGLLRRRKEGKKYLYSVASPDLVTREAALRRLSRDYFGGSLTRAARLLADMITREVATDRPRSAARPAFRPRKQRPVG